MELEIEIHEVTFDVVINFQEEERATRDFPGVDAAITDIVSIKHKGTDFMTLFQEMYGLKLEGLKELIWEEIINQETLQHERLQEAKELHHKKSSPMVCTNSRGGLFGK